MSNKKNTQMRVLREHIGTGKVINSNESFSKLRTGMLSVINSKEKILKDFRKDLIADCDALTKAINDLDLIKKDVNTLKPFKIVPYKAENINLAKINRRLDKISSSVEKVFENIEAYVGK